MSKIKKWKKLLTAGAVVLCFVSAAALSACADGKNDTNDAGQTKNILEKQIEQAQNLCDGFHEKSMRTGGLFTLTQSGDNGNTVKNTMAQQDMKTPLRDELSETSAADAFTPEELYTFVEQNGQSGYSKTGFSTYVCDIFNYVTALQNLTEKYGNQAFLSEITLDVSETDFYEGIFQQELNSFIAQWTRQSVLLTARYAGADEESGKVYLTQTHDSSTGRKGIATVEYEYVSDEDMSVTTINAYENSAGEIVNYGYHYFNLALGLNLYVNFSTENMSFISGSVRTLNRSYYLSSSSFDNEKIVQFARNEWERIEEKTKQLQAQNEEKADEEGIEPPAAEEVCSLDYDFKILKDMLGGLA